MEEIKSDSEIIAEIYRNAQLALTSIAEEYERICSEAASLAHKYDVDVKEPNPMKKAMMWSAIKMGTASDNSPQNIAQMMIRGTVNGITSLRTSLTDGGKVMDEEVKNLLTELINLEEGFEKKLKAFL